MKLEIIQHLNQCKLIDNDAFPFIFQEDLLQLQIEEINEIGLIDHNKLDISEDHLKSKITRIIDHHVDNKLYQDTLKEKEIQLIGSAATLVIEKLQTEFSESIDKEMAMFLLAPIVLDSFFFNENLKGSKWTEQDLNAYNYLVKVAEIDNGKEYFDNLYNAISNIELNLHLGINTLLIKDFKTYFVLQEGYKGVGVSSTFVPMRVLLKHFTFEAISQAFDKLMIERNLGLMAIISNYQDQEDNGKYHKQLLVYMNEDISRKIENQFDDFTSFLQEYKDFGLVDKIELTLENAQNENVRAVMWEIGNTKYSRKNFEVLLNQFYNQQSKM
eukprot:403347471